MATPRRRNISREIRDIKFPTSHVPVPTASADIPRRQVREVSPPRAPVTRRSRLPKWPLVVFLCVAIGAAAAGGFFWYREKLSQAQYVKEVLIETGHADQLPDILRLGDDLPTTWGGWTHFLKKAFSYYGGFGKISLQGFDAFGRASRLLEQLPELLIAKDGPGLVQGLTALQNDLASLERALDDLAARKEELQESVPDIGAYLAYGPDIDRAQAAISGALRMLQSPGEHHILILLANSAELRPGGGFLGSFADVSFGNGAVGDISVHDVNEVDRGMDANIIPPKPVQAVATRWRAADANWFFDYPTSAKKTLQLMGRSSYFASRTAATTTLDGAILISPRVIQDLLELTGPVTLPNSTTTVTAETIIPLIQREVQAGQARGAEAPKQILSDLLPLLHAKLQDREDAARASLIGLAQQWIVDKDLIFYFTDPGLAGAASYYGLDGGLYAIPDNFSGDYFAAVNANLGGGKSDAFISDTVEIESDLRTDGVISNRVTVMRTSSAGKNEEWWYRVVNQNYLQLFTPLGTTLASAEGGRARTIQARESYSAKGFVPDPDVAALEATLKPVSGIAAVSQFQEAGKNVFATWTTTAPGASSRATFVYERRLKREFRAGDRYTFVYERQPGARQSLDLVLNAPPGFMWQEKNVQQYILHEDATSGRIVVHLTLKEV